MKARITEVTKVYRESQNLIFCSLPPFFFISPESKNEKFAIATAVQIALNCVSWETDVILASHCLALGLWTCGLNSLDLRSPSVK